MGPIETSLMGSHWMVFPGNTFWCITLYLKFQSSQKLQSLNLISLWKGQSEFYRLESFLEKVTRLSWLNHWPALFIKGDLQWNVNFNFISCQKRCNDCLVIRNFGSYILFSNHAGGWNWDRFGASSFLKSCRHVL